MVIHIDPIIITSIATVVLAIVTIVYAILTGKMVSEMRKSREQEISPILEIYLIPFGSSSVVLEIKNVGRGSARKVKMSYGLEGDEQKKEWKWELLDCKESKRFGIPNGELNLTILEKNNKKLVVELKFSDILGRIYSKNKTIDFGEVKKGWHSSDMLLEESMEDYAKIIKDEIKKVSRSFTPLGIKVKKEQSPEKIKEMLEKFNKRKK